MNLKQFKAGNYVQRFEYKSFEPELINHTWVWDDAEINVLLERANKFMGELNAFTYIVPDIDLFIAMHILKEATKSSKIEGNKTEMDEALLPIEDISPEKRDDWQEVQNYIKAINFAVSELKNLPLSNRLIRDTHRILLEGTRGEHKTPGEFRISQNWIGGSNPSNAVFVPPHWDSLPKLLSDLEKFFHNQDIQVPHLIKTAIIHYQFETIHPFQDGNGRIGRLLITLYLISNGIINNPSLYLSDYFEKNRAMYYDSLTLVRGKNDLTNWIKFFLQAVEVTAEKGIITFRKILELKNKIDKRIISFKQRAENCRKLFNYLYKSPITDGKLVAKIIGISERSARDLLNDLESQKLLTEITGFKRNRNYIFHDYISLFYD